MVTGPGSEAVERAVEALLAGKADTRRSAPHLILAGVAGGLSKRARPGRAYPISRVVSESGETRFRLCDDDEGLVLCSVAKAVHSPQAKRDLHSRSGADLVDLESGGFVLACQRHGRACSIIRGVSDDATEALPKGVEAFVDEHGKPRCGHVLWSLLSHPWRIPAVISLARRTNAAMVQVAARLSDRP